MTFQELRLAEPIVRAVADEGYTTPTPIQTKAIPVALEGKDILGCAQTGTGKTAAFALPVLHRLNETRSAQPRHAHTGDRRQGIRAARPRALVLCPTRELATQIAESFRVYGRHLPIRGCVVFGGVSQARQEKQLSAGPDVLVATPGRLMDLMEQGFIDLGAVEIFVLDEADRMLDMGFIRDIRRIVKMVPERRQTMLFSATMPGEIRQLADSILTKPVSVQVDTVASAAPSIAQSVHRVEKPAKPALLEALIRDPGVKRTLVFTRTKHGADKVVTGLRRSGIPAEAIHGNKSQNARTRALDGFRSGRTMVLVATDIAARGIDVDGISHVFNYDIPIDPETYVHRIGRTARAGATGFAVSFCCNEEVNNLRAIERLIGSKLEVAKHEAGAPAPRRPAEQFRETNDFSDDGPRPAPRERHRRSSGTDAPVAPPTRARGESPQSRDRSGRVRKSEVGPAPRGTRPASRDSGRARPARSH